MSVAVAYPQPRPEIDCCAEVVHNNSPTYGQTHGFKEVLLFFGAFALSILLLLLLPYVVERINRKDNQDD